MDLNLKFLAIEITRRCNNSCLHCMRGDSEDLDISTDIIRNIFISNEYNIKSIDTLLFTGGEPLLNIDKILEIIVHIMEQKIVIHQFILVTNGLIYSNQLMDALTKFNEYVNIVSDSKDNSYITISYDQFHQHIKKEILDKYKNYPLFLDTCYLENYKVPLTEIIPMGNSKINNIGLEDKTVILEQPEAIYISANGNMVTNNALSYELIDMIFSKNILKNSLLDFINMDNKKSYENEYLLTKYFNKKKRLIIIAFLLFYNVVSYFCCISYIHCND